MPPSAPLTASTSGTGAPQKDIAGGTSSAPAPVDPRAALSNANPATADDSSGCAQVSTFRTANLDGIPMTPTEAFAKSPDVPNSAP